MYLKLIVIFSCILAINLTFSVAANADDFCDSKILSGERSFRRQLAQWLPGNGVWDVCWRASRDGWAASRFHAGCDNKGPTVTIVQVGRYIFGGYTDVSWAGKYVYKVAPNTFLFSLRNKDKLRPFRSYLRYRYTIYAVHAVARFGPSFGAGHDLFIHDNANKNRNSLSYFAWSFQGPPGYHGGQTKSMELLAGSYQFTPTEVEVYYLH